ncbi:AAA family ATPase [Agromyces seonyuensis]|uniref:AAA family ATPase n=1 Tax=Agromyces seonyuensis TaxID=2662446 RepID=A0A6I4NUF2_9MICO|nr:AAA family ATPase [Agromyces seonyuensis]MWB98018.1 AAA family ATPase [Agromyces seonyuensis]
MRIVVSGTHASGKSTLVDAFADRHPGFEVLADPFEFVDDAGDEPDAGVFAAQLRIASARLIALAPAERAIAERGPLDFLAYLAALDALGRPGRAGALFEQGVDLAARAMSNVDLLVLLPLEAGIRVPEDEDPELRAAMDGALLDLADDIDLTGGARVVELGGSPAARLAGLEAELG